MKNWLLLLGFVVLTVTPLFWHPSGSEFGGADGQAEAVIADLHTDYKPWFTPFWEPPSGEIESLLFVLQASLGTGVIAFGFGWWMGRRHLAKTQHHPAA
jgi:cobalt/nickel transport protein